MKQIVFFLLICFFSASLFVLARPVQAALNDPAIQENSRTQILDDSFFADLNLLKINNKSVLGASAVFRRAASLRNRLKGSYSPNEPIQFSLDNPDNDQMKAVVVSSDNEITPMKLSQTTTDGVTTVTVAPVKQMKPGKYRISMVSSNGTKIEQDFTWGVLAINTNKSVYAPNEKAHIEMAVLNENGAMVCNADVTLKIAKVGSQKETVLTTKNKDIIINPQCYTHDFTIKPDYETSYQTQDAGDYAMTLTAVTGKGTYTVSDSFQVRDNPAFDVERVTTTRIYPPLTYPVKFTIKANTDFDGVVKESVPENFTVTSFATNSAITDKVLGAHEADLQAVKDSEALSPSPTPLPAVKSEAPPYIANATKESSVAAVTAMPPIDVTPPPNPQTVNGTPHLRYPFNGNYPRTQGFGVMPDDQFLTMKYHQYGVVGHDGMDFGLPWGTPVVAADSGIVIFAGPGDYGNTIIIQHDWGRTYYGHLSKIEVHVAQEVGSGIEIGISGNTGLSSGPHLHFGVRPNNFDPSNGYYGKVDPSIYFTGSSQTNVEGEATVAPDFARPPQKGLKEISLPLHIKKGETVTLEYQYQAPQVSPQFYVLGPLQFVKDNGSVVFAESRQWQIAADAVWYNTSWSYRKAISIDHTKVPNTTQTNFPILISLSADSNLISKARGDGFDILFTSSDGSTKIPAERVSYSSGTLLAWVKVPSVSNTTNSVIYMYYGNAGSCDQSASACDAGINSTDVWSNVTAGANNYGGVWHMDTDPSSGGHTEPDSTANVLTLNQGSTAFVAGDYVTGQIAKAVQYGDSKFDLSMNHGSTATLGNSGDMTISGWYNSTNLGVENSIVWQDCGCVSSLSYYLYKSSSNTFAFQWADNAGNAPPATNSVTASSGTWYYVAGTESSGTHTIYVNGSSASSTPASTGVTMAPNSSTFTIGAVFDTQPAHSIDEVRYLPAALTGDWLATEYNNQTSPSTFYSVGVQDCYPGNYPAMSFIMRHGKYFDICGKHAFVF